MCGVSRVRKEHLELKRCEIHRVRGRIGREKEMGKVRTVT